MREKAGSREVPWLPGVITGPGELVKLPEAGGATVTGQGKTVTSTYRNIQKLALDFNLKSWYNVYSIILSKTVILPVC